MPSKHTELDAHRRCAVVPRTQRKRGSLVPAYAASVAGMNTRFESAQLNNNSTREEPMASEASYNVLCVSLHCSSAHYPSVGGTSNRCSGRHLATSPRGLQHTSAAEWWLKRRSHDWLKNQSNRPMNVCVARAQHAPNLKTPQHCQLLFG